MSKPRTKAEIELRRWCIEQAIRWPIETLGHLGYGVVSGGGGAPRMDVDLLARAEKILAWVNK